MESLKAETTRHLHTDQSVKIPTNPHTCTNRIYQMGRGEGAQAQHKHVLKLETTAQPHSTGTLNMYSCKPCETPYMWPQST